MVYSKSQAVDFVTSCSSLGIKGQRHPEGQGDSWRSVVALHELTWGQGSKIQLQLFEIRDTLLWYS